LDAQKQKSQALENHLLEHKLKQEALGNNMQEQHEESIRIQE